MCFSLVGRSVGLLRNICRSALQSLWNNLLGAGALFHVCAARVFTFVQVSRELHKRENANHADGAATRGTDANRLSSLLVTLMVSTVCIC